MYLGSLALAKYAMSMAAPFSNPPELVEPPLIPIDGFNQCVVLTHYRFKEVPTVLGTVFGE